MRGSYRVAATRVVRELIQRLPSLEPEFSEHTLYGLVLDEVVELGKSKEDRLSVDDLVDITTERFLYWFRTGYTWATDPLNVFEVARLVASHRRSCAWAVLYSKYLHWCPSPPPLSALFPRRLELATELGLWTHTVDHD